MNSNEHGRRCGWGRRRFLRFPLIILFVLVKSAVIFFLWNELVPDLFHGPVLTYLQAIELTVLVKLLVGFGGFRGHHGGGHFGRHPWMKFSHEEREKLREDLRRRHEK